MLRLILFCMICCCSGFCQAANVTEHPSDVVIVIIKDDGTVMIREPRELDYKYGHISDTTAPRNLKELIFGKKSCGRKAGKCPLRN